VKGLHTFHISPTEEFTEFTFASVATKNKDVGAKRVLRTRTTFSSNIVAALMMTVGLSKLGCTGLILVNTVQPIDGQ